MYEIVTVRHTLSETFFAFLLTLIIVRKVAVNYGCLGTSGAHH